MLRGGNGEVEASGQRKPREGYRVATVCVYERFVCMSVCWQVGWVGGWGVGILKVSEPQESVLRDGRLEGGVGSRDEGKEID